MNPGGWVKLVPGYEALSCSVVQELWYHGGEALLHGASPEGSGTMGLGFYLPWYQGGLALLYPGDQALWYHRRSCAIVPGHQAPWYQGAPAKTGTSENHLSNTLSTSNCCVHCDQAKQFKHVRHTVG